MDQQIKRLLATYKKKTIKLAELEFLMKSFLPTYAAFAEAVLQLEKQGILVMVKAKGRTSRTPSLAFNYRINKNLIVEDFHVELQHYRSTLHAAINLDLYYGKDPSLWKKDLPAILKIDAYIKEHGFPDDQVPAPERSYALVGDEKWIVEKGGKEVLERIGLFDRLQIIPVSEPLMFAINPKKIHEASQYHLIVENKTTYQGLLPALKETMFASLIYGSGKAVIKSMEQFSMQYPVEAKHHFFYFGDIDREGIAIWHSLDKKIKMILAMPFYQACLVKTPSIGKEYQREQITSLEQFLPFFSDEQQEQMKEMLANGKYHPQETLKTKELQQIWRESDWTNLI
ncbi:hypothetical protein GCM10011351_00960 [Paraliobacillus quinghaiensis]|uniref:Wadjet protein JetD C-terminal domain-containing protein n=1 Tax=Paraliobacillus quinghaiensis TaxID=470815 RepID=A0A917WPD1_9BACI|nr:Wadjet anti-phage system protein JetD domain-containing protein [Paraliobacillus quinghaiensis]GGM18997.1 hypothetical protein GCM10011351_00960 [Paraliobacillus quinghaiensis]